MEQRYLLVQQYLPVRGQNAVERSAAPVTGSVRIQNVVGVRQIVGDFKLEMPVGHIDDRALETQLALRPDHGRTAIGAFTRPRGGSEAEPLTGALLEKPERNRRE